MGQSGSSACLPPHHKHHLATPSRYVASQITSNVLGARVLPGELSFSTRSHLHVNSKKMSCGCSQSMWQCQPPHLCPLVASAGLWYLGCWVLLRNWLPDPQHTLSLLYRGGGTNQTLEAIAGLGATPPPLPGSGAWMQIPGLSGILPSTSGFRVTAEDPDTCTHAGRPGLLPSPSL